MKYVQLMLLALGINQATQLHSMQQVKVSTKQMSSNPHLLMLGGAAICAYLAYHNYHNAHTAINTAHHDTNLANSAQYVGEEDKSKTFNHRATLAEEASDRSFKKAGRYSWATIGLTLTAIILWLKNKPTSTTIV